MLKRLTDFFQQTETQGTLTQNADALHVAAAALMVRAAQIDGDIDAHEQALIQKLIGPHFGLDAGEAETLLTQAHEALESANDLFQFTQQINASFSIDHKLQLVEVLWQIVLADGVVDDYEANLMRRVAGLVYITDQQAGAARNRAMAALGQSETDS